MKKLGDQWVEIIDGVEHMVKAVAGVLCKGCMFSSMCLFGIDRNFNLHRCEFDGDCPVGGGDRYNLQNPDIIVKDLGILRDGVLSCPFCGEYPKVGNFGDGFGPISFYVTHRNDACDIWGGMRTKSFDTPEQAKDAWNKRA